MKGLVAEGLQKKVRNYDIGKELKPRYFSAEVALLDHLQQLDELGCGNISAVDLVTMGACGYGSLEKMPIMIKLGLMNSNLWSRMRQVINDVTEWTTTEEDSFRLKSQNI